VKSSGICWKRSDANPVAYLLRPMRSLSTDRFACEGVEVTGFFFNHNIHPYQEYVRRRDAAQQMADLEGMPLIAQG
jgi:predicted adenine nucleotide alpha hydrolase (AANH) superfamily ATPase